MAAAGLVLGAAQRLPNDVKEFTGPRGTDTLVARHLPIADVVEWVFRWTPEEPPVHPGEERVVELGERHHEELLAFLREHSPGHSTGPGSSGISLWAGIRDEDGRLVACGALSSLRDSGAPLMASVATDARQRGQGLGAALTSWLTRYAVRRHGFCTLWQLAGNAPPNGSTPASATATRTSAWPRGSPRTEPDTSIPKPGAHRRAADPVM
ncbi:Acetyltransferase (GNAT) domain-containing protein [Streptomyces melanosporofaciens]|uniref:Acetyltransferase (GNAT) domain-containing protein n=1 Tax=Streptomyces melanosporofaciens TaxID=67327 RepID=A0A1H5BLQ9_STRMJ|nr:Acetyltransferase (GNAT) domain-containing protein [Streptomyces melanosporofaciens]